jgi:DNA replication protein DnaC
MRLAECNFINGREIVIITGSTPIGKSYIASALGHQACLIGTSVSFLSLSKSKINLSDGTSESVFGFVKTLQLT